ncbi:transposase IS200 like protein [bacterium BMS3Abin15]|nr:transposase IS200 like protein [bacterium BMS3Abin15]HDZ85799.1 hypothetical protein [Candidatus Moranbacteria bacterium]
MRKIKFANNEYYHIFNRGVDKREVFLSEDDFLRFFQSMDEFNVPNPIGSIFENSFRKNKTVNNQIKKNKESELVEFICYCLNPNHYHFIVKQVADNGIEKFMHKIGTGYTKYFNKKYNRSGSLFQGSFKAVHVESNEQLLHVSVYVNLNNKIHQLGSLASKSSWGEYIKKNASNFCKKEIILGQFNDNLEYKAFAEKFLKGIQKRKETEKFLLE